VARKRYRERRSQAQTAFPSWFNDTDPQPLPADARDRIVEIGVDKRTADDVRRWWAKQIRRREMERENERIAARVAALARARELFPDLFAEDSVLPVPADIHTRLIDAGIPAPNILIEWWCRRPAYRAARRRREAPNLERRRASLALLRDLAPDVMNPDAPRPLAIGTRHHLDELGMSKDAVAEALRWWCRRRQYLQAVAAGGTRYAIDGGIAEPITPEQQQQAANDLERLAGRDRLRKT